MWFLYVVEEYLEQIFSVNTDIQINFLYKKVNVCSRRRLSTSTYQTDTHRAIIMNYQEFIVSKQLKAVNAGFDINIDELNSNMFEWQKMLVKWGLKKGKCAFFEDCGLGKTIQQLVWADETRKYSNKPSLILAPLAVAEQTKLQGEKFGVEVNICEFQADIKN